MKNASTKISEAKKRKPSQIILDMQNLMLTGPKTKTGNPQLDIIVHQLRTLAAHCDAVDAFLDSQYE